MNTSRFVKIALQCGRTLAINPANVISVCHHAKTVSIEYAIPNTGGFWIVGSGFGDSSPYTKNLTYDTEEMAKTEYDKIIQS